MIVFAHRINTVKEMSALPLESGAELDVRDHKDLLVAAHDPFTGGDSFEDVIKASGRRPLIVNVKCEGIENAVIGILSKNQIEDYFLLDCTFPSIVKLTKEGFNKIALRFSEYEGMDTLKNLKGKAEWVWADCFTKHPFDVNTFHLIKDLGYKICLVSPDLLGRPEEVAGYAAWFMKNRCFPDAVCVKIKNKDKWDDMLM